MRSVNESAPVVLVPDHKLSLQKDVVETMMSTWSSYRRWSRKTTCRDRVTEGYEKIRRKIGRYGEKEPLRKFR